jgi:hypothetical protein
MRTFHEIRLALVLSALLAAALSLLIVAPLVGQDDANETPLGDIARNLRKTTPPAQQIIDDDNLLNVIDQAESRHTAGSVLKYLMGPGDKDFQVSAPNVTCSLSFAANAKSVLSGQYAQMNLPAADVLKLEGPASIEGDALIVSVFNGTTWHLSELTVAFTVTRKSAEPSLSNGSPDFAQPAMGSSAEDATVRPEKKADLTVIYRMRAAAAPFSTTVFSAPLNEQLARGEEWHWAIVQARGYPPQNYAESAVPSSAQADAPTPLVPTPPAAPLEKSSATSLPQFAQ